MNKWAKGSLDLASSDGYLDKLQEIYPVGKTLARQLSPAETTGIKRALARKNPQELILSLLNFKRFPIDDPYVGFLRRDKTAISKNPQTAERIGKQLIALKFEGIVAGITRPIAASKQFGHSFRHWLAKLGLPLLGETDFINYKGTAILKGGDAALQKFAEKHLGYRRKKGLDIILKKGTEFVLGEAKLITTSGGTQDKSFREGLDFIRKKEPKYTKIAILDGVVWLPARKKATLYNSVAKLRDGQIALSALLLKDFIKNL